MVDCDEEVDELGMIGYNGEKEQVVKGFDSDDDDEEMKKGFLMKNGGRINHGAVSVVSGV